MGTPFAGNPRLARTSILWGMQKHQKTLNGAEVVRRWTCHPRSVRLARAELSRALAAWDLTEIEDAALVVLSELVTNAVRHARIPSGREIETRYALVGAGLRIEVHDAAETRPRRLAVGADAENGRGLALVEALADEWGISDRVGCGKAVWAVVSAVPGVGRSESAGVAERVPVGGTGG